MGAHFWTLYMYIPVIASHVLPICQRVGGNKRNIPMDTFDEDF